MSVNDPVIPYRPTPTYSCKSVCEVDALPSISNRAVFSTGFATKLTYAES